MIDNRENNIWTVYVHIVPKTITEYDYDKYYVGITSKSVKERWRYKGSGYVNQMFYYAIQKYGWDNIEHFVIANHLTENEAEQMEKVLILKLKSNDKYGYNITEGGDHKKGSNPFYGKKHTKETRLKMSKNHVDFYGDKNPRAKKFHQFNLNGKYVATYGSVRSAARAIGVTDGIGQGAKQHKPSCGFLWGYDNDVTIINGVPQLNYI